MAQQVLARLIPRSALQMGDPVTAENVDEYGADEEVIREASRILSELGFHIEQADRTGIAFAGDPSRFEEVFRTRLQGEDEPLIETGGREAVRSYFEPTEPIEIPEELVGVAEAVVLPRPPKLFPSI